LGVCRGIGVLNGLNALRILEKLTVGPCWAN